MTFEKKGHFNPKNSYQFINNRFKKVKFPKDRYGAQRHTSIHKVATPNKRRKCPWPLKKDILFLSLMKLKLNQM